MDLMPLIVTDVMVYYGLDDHEYHCLQLLWYCSVVLLSIRSA